MEKQLEQSKLKQKDLQVRADRWQESKAGGRPAAVAVADYTGADGRKMAEYTFAVYGDTTALCLKVQAPRDRLDH